MLLRKYMSLLGIGSATIDLILPKDSYYPGEFINGCFLIKGGTVNQNIRRIECDLVMKDLVTNNEKVIDTVTVLSSKQIESGSTSELSFTFKLAEYLPISSDIRSYRFKTRLTFDEGVESKDQDTIQINPAF
jgi:sporulation-control protein